MQEQTKWDSRRGLKRSWSASPEEGPSTGARPTAEEKGQYKFCSDPIQSIPDFEFYKTEHCHPYTVTENSPLYPGKSGGKSVAKNAHKKKKADDPTKNNSLGSFTIPKSQKTVEASSEEEDRGTSPASSRVCVNKFYDSADSQIRSVLRADNLIPKEMSSLCCAMENLIVNSVCKQTWAKHRSAWNLYKSFCNIFNVNFDMPIPIKIVRAFATWAITERNLKSATVKSYISSLNTAHTLSNTDSIILNSDPCLKMILKGAENVFYAGKPCKTDRLPMNIHLLNILCHKIYNLNWTDFSKQVVWTACVISFFSSCRMGELLPAHENYFDPLTTLTWGKIKFLDRNEAIIFIPFTKTTGFKGKLLDIFEAKEGKICPAATLAKLKQMAEKRNLLKHDIPVFSFSNTKFLTRKKLNFYLAELLADFTDPYHKITGHSFRAAIPSALALSTADSKVADIKEWCRWNSDSYLLYTKNESDQRKAIFDRVVKSIYEM